MPRLCRGISPMGLPEYLGMLMSETLLVVQSSWKCLCVWVLDRLLFLYTAWLLASSIYMFRKTRTGRGINTFVSLVARLIKMIGGTAPIPLQPKAVTNEPLN